MKTRTKFREQLLALNNEMVKMGQDIISAMTRSIDALFKKDEKAAQQIMDNDVLIDREKKSIERICFDLIIRQQPVATDLRVVTAAMKMVTDMERIGDHASDIAEMILLMGQESRVNDFDNFKKMASETMVMLNHCIESYQERDITKANDVIAYDDIVDVLFHKTKKDIINLILTSPKEGEEAADLLLIAKYFERIGDHACNIAEWVIYALKHEDEPVGAGKNPSDTKVGK